MGDVWQGNGFAPDIEEGQAQFKEGAVIVKLALQTASPEQWPVIDGAELWPLFIDPDGTGIKVNYEAWKCCYITISL